MKKNTNHFERLSQAQQAENALKEHRKRVGEVEYVTISGRTTFEFPASLSEEEREIRIENYIKRHKPLVLRVVCSSAVPFVSFLFRWNIVVT